MRIHADGVRKLLRSNTSAFVVITSPEEAALDEALYFKGRIKELGLTTEGFVLNRSYASNPRAEHPSVATSRLSANGALASALKKLGPLGDVEKQRIESDRGLLAKLEKEGKKDGGKGAMALPYLDEVVEDLPALNTLSSYIVAAV